MVILSSHGKEIVNPSHSEPLPQWTYTPSSQSSEFFQTKTSSTSLRSSDRSDSPSNEIPEVQSSQVPLGLDAYEWPSEASRYNTVAASHDFLALTAPNDAKQPPCAVKVGVTHISPCGMAQYRTSTLRVLVRTMRQHHDDQYDSLAGSYSGDQSFWTVLYIDLDNSWNLTSRAQLEHRFSWVLELIRTGSLPAQAEAASEILQKRLGGVFLEETHPYNYKVQCSTRKFLNPDLSPEWTKAFLTAKDALEAVESEIQDHMGGYNIEGFCSMYGILITQLWEQAMSERGYFYPGLALVSPCAATFATRLTSDETAAHEAQDHVQNQAPTDESGNQRPPSPPPYPPLKGHAVTKKCTKWEANEMDYLKYLMRLFIPQKDMLAKFHGRFGQDRTLQALVTQVKLIRKDMLGQTEQETLQKKPSVRPATLEPDTPKVSRERDNAARTQSAASTYLKDQGDDKCEHSRSLLQTCDNWDHVTSEMKTKFGPKGSQQVFTTIARLEKMDTSRMSASRLIPWTAEDHAKLEDLLDRCTTWKEVCEGLGEEYPKGRSLAMVRQYAKAQKTDLSDITSQLRRWTTEEDSVLRELFDSGVPRREHPKKFLERMGPGRTRGAIVERIQQLGLLVNSSWSDEELQNVRDNLHLGLKEFVTQFWDKFGRDRTHKTLKERRHMLKSAQQDE